MHCFYLLPPKKYQKDSVKEMLKELKSVTYYPLITSCFFCIDYTEVHCQSYSLTLLIGVSK